MAIKTKLASLTPARERCKRTITLLSHGYYAKTAFPNGDIEVFPWDSYADDILLSSREDLKLKALYSLIPRLCNLNGCKATAMLAGDAMTVLLVSRSFRTACMTQVSTVNSVGKKVSITVKIPDNLERVGEKDPGYAGVDVITLPDAGDEIGLRPLTIGDEITVEEMKSGKYAEHPADALRFITGLVHVGNGEVEDPEEALAYWNALSVPDQLHAVAEQDRLSPHLSNTATAVDITTGQEIKVTLNLGYDFFR